jgi:hypothetical protein
MANAPAARREESRDRGRSPGGTAQAHGVVSAFMVMTLSAL